MAIDYKTDYSQPWNERIGSLPKSILYSVMPRHKMVKDNQISFDNQPPPIYALTHEKRSHLTSFIVFVFCCQVSGSWCWNMWQEGTELSECLIHRSPGSPTLTFENGSKSSVSPHLLLGVRLAPHLLLGLGLPMHLVVSLRSGQRMHWGGDAGKAPNFLGNGQPWDF